MTSDSEKELNPKALASLPKGEHRDSTGLFLVVSETGNRSWIVKYQWGGKQQKMGLGAFPGVSLAKARVDARDARDKARKGIDPRLAKKQAQMPERKVPSFKEFASEICDTVVEGLKGEKSKEKWRRGVNIYMAPLHKLPINAVGVEEVLAVLKPMWRTKPTAARETRACLQYIFGAAKAAGHIERNAINPASWPDNLKFLLGKQGKAGKRGKNKAVPFAEMPDFMVELRALTQQSARMLEVCILTCARTNEILQMEWSQIDWKKAAG